MDNIFYLQRALHSFNTSILNWYGWKKDYTGDERMSYENVIVIKEGAILPSESEVNAKIALLKLEYAFLELRTKRDNLLKETDYLALSDNTLSANMSTYRQALRDITNGLTTVEQVNNVTWPTKP
jgi:hypothetical protein